MARTATPPAPQVDEEITLDVTVRVTLRGKREVIERNVRDRFERELVFMFPEARIKQVKRATR